LTVMLLVCVAVIVGSAILRWMKPAQAGETVEGHEARS
jgi:hypothetical protein